MIFLVDNMHSIKKFSLMLSLLICLSLQAQSPDMLISIHLKKSSMKELTAKIEKLSGYSFIYGEEVVLKHPVTLSLKKTPVKIVLQKAFAGQGIEFKITKQHIVLKKEKVQPVKRRFTINGYVLDNISKETLIGANIYDRQNERGTTTNPFGYFSITLPEGNTKLNISYIGYATREITLQLCKDTLLTIPLHSDNQLEEVIILSDKPETGIESSRMGASSIPLVHIKNTPTLLSEADVLKSIQLLPGVQSGMSGTSGLHIRGGGPDQNLYLLDGVPLYNVDHTLGLFSIFTPEAVKKVDLYKGSFPARFGGRLSSIIDIRTNDGDMQHYHGSFTIGLLTSHLHFEGPLWKNRTSFIISARRSYLDCFLPFLMPENERGGYNLYDMNAKLNHRFSGQDRIFLSFYKGKDHVYYKYKDEDNFKQTHDWGNLLLNARWNHVFTSQLFSNTSLTYSKYTFDIKQDETSSIQRPGQTYISSYNERFHSGIEDISFSTDFDYHPQPAHNIKFGGKYIYHTFAPTIQTNRIVDETTNGNTPSSGEDIDWDKRHIHAHDALLYAEDDFELNERWKFNAGVHLSLFHVQKQTYLSVQPRFSASFHVAPDIILKGSFTQMNQYTQLLSTSSLAMPSDLWVPVTRHIRPMKAFQYSAGIYYKGIKHWEFSAEGYYKNIHNVLEYKNGEGFLGSSHHWEEKVEMGKGRSFGLELMAEKTAGRLTGWLSYALAKADRQFATGGINNGKRFPYRYDRRHTVNLTLNYQLTKRIDFNLSWNYASGNMATLPKEKTNVVFPPFNTPSYSREEMEKQQYGDMDYYNSRNNYRLPGSHQLDVGINFHKKTKHGERIWNISILNAYNAMNPNFVYIKREEITKKPILKKMTLLPCIPSFSYTYKF